jgi:hypothetical protein
MWLDDCRIPFVDETEMEGVCKSDKTKVKDDEIFVGRYNHKRTGGDTKGRFTPNLLVCDDMLNDGNITKAGEYKGEGSKSGGIWNNSTGKPAGVEYGDKGSNSRYYDLDLWFDKMLERL